MSSENIKISTVIMSAISLLFLLVVLLTSVKTDSQSNSSAKNFKNFVTKMIKEQSSKIQTLLKKIQTNAQSVLEKMETIKEKEIKKKLMFKNNEVGQVESPLKTNLEIEPYSRDAKSLESRSFSGHYGTTSYGTSGNANYGAPTYHHHSIGFDPINIVVSMSLLSFLLQALQGLLTRARPTPVVEARSLNAIEDWTNNFQNKLAKEKFYIKKKYLKNYY